MQPIHGTEAENRIDGSDKEGNLTVLPSGQITNPTEEDVAVLHCIGIKIDNDNYPAPDNVPEQQEQHHGNVDEGGEVWKSEGIICPRKANNLQVFSRIFGTIKKRRC